MTSIPPIVRQRSTFGDYGSELRSQLPLVWKLARYQLQAEISDTRLGFWWLAISPLLVAIPSILIFGYLLEVDRGVVNYPLFSMIGLLSFRILSRTWTRTARTFRPRGRPNIPDGVPIPIGVAAFALHETLVGAMGLTLCFIWALATGFVSGSTPLLLVVLPIAFAVANGGGLIIASVSRRSADVAEALPHITRTLGHASGVWFAPALFSEGRWFAPIFDWNPITVMLELFRVALMGSPLRSITIVSLVTTTVLSNIIGVAMLWRTKRIAL